MNNKDVKIRAVREGKEPSGGLDYVKLIARHTHNIEIAARGKKWKAVGDIKRFDVQMPVEGHDLVVHVSVLDNGQVNVQARKKKFDGTWWDDLANIDISSELAMRKLGK